MLLTTKSGLPVEMPTDEEEAEINAGIAADPDTLELDDAFIARTRPAAEVLPEIFGATMAAEMLKPKGGRPRTNTPKVFTGIRLDAEVLEAFRSNRQGLANAHE